MILVQESTIYSKRTPLPDGKGNQEINVTESAVEQVKRLLVIWAIVGNSQNVGTVLAGRVQRRGGGRSHWNRGECVRPRLGKQRERQEH